MADEQRPEPDAQEESRRVWRGAVRSLLLPVAIVLTVAGVAWYSQSPGGDDSTALVQLDAEVDANAIEHEGAPRTGHPAPGFALPALDGTAVRLTDLRGQAVIVNFWATWCGPCRTEMPLLADVAREHRDDGLVVVGINLQEHAGEVEGFVDDFQIEFPIALDSDGEVKRRYQLIGVPSTFFIDRDGVLRSTFFGPLAKDDIEERLPPILAVGE